MSIIEALIETVELIVRMTWDTWWALVLGFTLSGVVETFASEERMTELLGDDGWHEVGLGMLFGAAASSCSYSAVGTSKALFKKGASGVASLGAFLFASTDLVVELGLVIWVLLGWQFVVGGYAGGVIATLVVVLILKHAVPQRWFDAARDRLNAVEETTCAACGMEANPTDEETTSVETIGGTEYFCCGGCLHAYESRTDGEIGTSDVAWTEKLLTADGWDVAAKKSIKEWEMLWEDIALGFVLAGLIGAFVPASWWATLFGTGEGFRLVLLNTVIAVVIGVVTFMCSVGNVPFALVLWQNGLPFGSVLSFIYADLIIPPLVNIYRRYYGPRLAATLFGAIFVAAVVAGVVIHYLMGGLGLIPPDGQASGTLSGEYTLVLNLLFTPVFLAQVYVTYGADVIEQWLRGLPSALRRRIERGRLACRHLDAGLRELLDATTEASRTTGEALRLLGSAVYNLVIAIRLLWRGLRSVLRSVWNAITDSQ